MWTLIVLGAGYGFVVASAVASFLCVVAERVPAGQTVTGRSRCACGRMLKPWENVPVFGWLRVRGKTPCCGSVLPVSMLYAEVALGVWGGLVGAGVARVLVDGGTWWGGVLLASAGLLGGAAVTLDRLWPRSARP